MGLMKKIVIVFIVIIVLAGGAGYFLYDKFMGDDVRTAFLSIESGTAEVDKGNGWREAFNGIDLKDDYKVRSKGGTSVIILYESIFAELEPGTEVMIRSLKKEKISLRQESGSTWHKFTAIAGIENYEVETPTTVAVVRGTEFGIDYETESGEATVLVGEGNVTVKSGEESIDLEQFEKMLRTEDGLQKVELTPEDKQRILEKAKKNLERLKKIREGMIQENDAIVGRAIEAYGVSREELGGYLDKIDVGEIDDAELLEKSPIKLPVMYRVKKVNDEIKKQQEFIEKIKNL